MKKAVALLMIFAVLLSAVSCKKKIEDEVGYVDFEQKDQQQSQSAPEQTPEEPETEALTTQKEQTEDKKQESEPIPEIPTLSDSNNGDGGETELPTFAPVGVYTAEYLPEKLGYVKKQTNNGTTFYYNAVKDFETREPITEQMIDAAKKYGQSPYFDYTKWQRYKNLIDSFPYLPINTLNENSTRGCYVIREHPNADWFGNPEKYSTDLEYLESWFDDDTFVVKGHFEDSYGDSYARYSVNDNGRYYFNYEIEPYTVYNFVIDKVYDENSKYKAGDVIEVGLEGTIMQGYDGFYCSVSSPNVRSTSTLEYVSFKGKTLEQRTFIISLKPPSVNNRPDGIFTVDYLCHNAYDTETVYTFSNKAFGPEKVTAKEILEKYN